MEFQEANLYTCNNCGLFVIAEELDLHKCLEIKIQKIDGEDFVFDGIKQVPLTSQLRQWLSTPKVKHSFKTPKDENGTQMKQAAFRGPSLG